MSYFLMVPGMIITKRRRAVKGYQLLTPTLRPLPPQQSPRGNPLFSLPSLALSLSIGGGTNLSATTNGERGGARNRAAIKTLGYNYKLLSFLPVLFLKALKGKSNKEAVNNFSNMSVCPWWNRLDA